MKTYKIYAFPHDGGRATFTRNFHNDRAANDWANEVFASGNFKFVHLLRNRALIARLGY